ncbi:MAG TPA: FG-GAP-like repeat-containing protein [Cystobacter sp.]
MRRKILLPLLGVLAGALAACGGDALPKNTQLVAVEDGQPGPVHALSGQQLDTDTELLSLENANLRGGPSTSATVLAVVPRDATLRLLDGIPRDGFYKVSFAGLQGWTYGAHYTESVSVMSREQALTANEILTRSATVQGFSYWWGHGVWNPGSTSPGSCSGGCPNCTHSGSYGADCSGFVAKVWQVPSTNTNYTVDSHPYSTATFNTTTTAWDPVPRGSVQPGDAFVYNDGSGGHIFIYSSGDPWGAMSTYECKGCESGCGKGYRSSVGTAYKVIRRRGLTGSATQATRFVAGGKWASGVGGANWADTGDFNGDGKADIAWFEAWNGGAISVLLSNGTSFALAGKWASGLGGADWVGVGDFNGDGKADIAWYEGWNGGAITLLRSTGTSFGPGGKWASGIGGSNWAGVGDFNGDGKADIAWYEIWNNNSVSLLLSTGTSFGAGGKWASGLGGPDLVRVGDFTGDGKADLAWYEAWNDGSISVLSSTGNSLALTGKWVSSWAKPDWAGAGDFDGDKRADVAWYEIWNGSSISTGLAR